MSTALVATMAFFLERFLIAYLKTNQGSKSHTLHLGQLTSKSPRVALADGSNNRDTSYPLEGLGLNFAMDKHEYVKKIVGVSTLLFISHDLASRVALVCTLFTSPKLHFHKHRVSAYRSFYMAIISHLYSIIFVKML